MRAAFVILLAFVGACANAQTKDVRGKISYLAMDNVYTSLGREGGVQDSTLLFVVSNGDTVATLKVFAVSSKSSACRVVKAKRPLAVGDDVVASVVVAEEKKAAVDSTLTIPAAPSSGQRPSPSLKLEDDADFISVQGRISAQYFTSLYDNSAFNISQPGIVVNLRGGLRDAPVKFDVYANLRTLSVGGRSPFSSGAINQSRIYGLSVGYDDGENVVTVGRIIPVFAPSVGYIDGLLASKKLGNVTVGTTLGLQPDFSLRGISSDFKKLALFAQYLSDNRMSLSVSTAYARTYFHTSLDREAASLLLSSAITQDLYLYANSEVDLRKKKGDDLVLSPALTSAYVNLSYRITSSFSVGLGADASRPYYSFEAIRRIPDSLLANELRSGVSVNFSWFLPGRIYLFNTFTPRSAEKQSFGKEYSNSSSISFNNIFSSGANLRTSLNLNANQYTNGTGYGVSLQKSFEQLVDVNLRFQRNGYTIKQIDQKNFSTTLGADLLVFITNSLTFITTYDRLEGYGVVSNSVFGEFSVRF